MDVYQYHRMLENPNPWSGPRRDLVQEEYRTEKDAKDQVGQDGKQQISLGKVGRVEARYGRVR
jgi:hypothetical protein